MKGLSGLRIGLAAALVTLAGLADAGGSMARLAPGGNPCALISSSKLESALGLTRSDQTPEIRTEEPGGGVAYGRCSFLVWSGAAPKTLQQAVQKIDNGTGASVVIEAWVPDPGPNESSWEQDSYGPRVDQQVLGCKSIEQHKHGHPVHHLPLFGAQGVYGATGMAFGSNVCAVWHRDDTFRFIELTLKESPHRNAVKDFKRIAKPIVSQFW